MARRTIHGNEAWAHANVNDLFLHLGIEHLKPLATALLLPPTPFLLLAIFGVVAIGRHRRIGSWTVAASLAMVWLSGCVGVANALAPRLLDIFPPLTRTQITELGRHAGEHVAIIVLGSGVEPWAPEYGASSLQYRSLERLRYGVWLGRQTGWPTGFSGGVGWGQPATDASASEAVVAQRIATEEFGRPLRWAEAMSRDTRENARNTVAMLRMQGVKRIVLVTSAWHMQRAVRNFERASVGDALRVQAAPIGLAVDTEWPWMRWMPSGEGFDRTRVVLREWIGLLSGA